VLIDEAPEPKVLVKEDPVPMVDAPLEVRLVKAPVEVVVAPIAVELIPVEVVLKLLEVIVKAFAPVEIEDADNPVKEIAPEVAVRLRAPVLCVNPFDAVSSPANVPVPVPVVDKFPLVVTFPEELT